MLCVEVALLRLTMGYMGYGIGITLAALLGCLPQLQMAWSFRARAAAMGAIAAGFYLLLLLDAFDSEALRAQFVDEPGSLAGALCFIVLQAAQYYWRSPRGLPDYYPLLGILSLAFSADRYLSEPGDIIYAGICAMSFGVLMALYYTSEKEAHDPRRNRWRAQRYGAIGLCLLLSMALASGTAWLLKNSDRAVAQWMANRIPMERIGLGNNSQTRLDSITSLKTHNQDRIALQITAEQPPGYLRGQAYADFEGDLWTALAPGESATVRNEALPGYAPQWRDEYLYAVRPEAAGVERAMTVFPGTDIDRAIFAPADTGWLGRRGGLLVNEAGVMHSPAALEGEPYQVLTAKAGAVAPMSEKDRARYTDLPPELATRLAALSNKICAGQNGSRAKAEAIAAYFHFHYQYTLGIQVPEGQDAMAYFLFSEPLPAAHCEFFASGAALLLRAAGVPARYVTGVGVWEKHPFADYWVARNRDAHAWVEAWDDNKGWFLVEATPSNGLPEASGGLRASTLGDLWSLITLHVRQLIGALRDGAWRAAVGVVAALLLGLYEFVQEAGLPLVMALGLIIVLLRLIRYRKQRPARMLHEGEFERRMHGQLKAMDRTVRRRHQIERAPHVTPHAFALVLEKSPDVAKERGRIARWYRTWAEMRYQASADSAAVDGLETEIQALKSRKRRKLDG